MFVKPRVEAIQTRVPAAFGKVLIWGYSVKYGDSVRFWPWSGADSFRFALDYALQIANSGGAFKVIPSGAYF